MFLEPSLCAQLLAAASAFYYLHESSASKPRAPTNQKNIFSVGDQMICNILELLKIFVSNSIVYSFSKILSFLASECPGALEKGSAFSIHQ